MTVAADDVLAVWHHGVQCGIDSEREAVAAFIARQGGMQWLVEHIEAGDHCRDTDAAAIRQGRE